MKEKEILDTLLEVAELMGMKVLRDTFRGRGGYCRAKEKEYVIINRKLSLAEQIEIVKEAVMKKDIDNIYLPPVVRELITEDSKISD